MDEAVGGVQVVGVGKALGNPKAYRVPSVEPTKTRPCEIVGAE
jgi:hypothetical protein